MGEEIPPPILKYKRMTLEEFSELFDVNYNNITSNQAPGLNEYEKSVFLTKAQDEIIKNYFTANSKGNNIQQGFDDSAKRQADFSILMKTATCDPATVSGSSVITRKKYTCSYNGSSQVLYGGDITFGGGVTPANNVGDPYTVRFNPTTGKTTAGIIVEGSSSITIVDVEGFPFDLPSGDTGSLEVADEQIVSESGIIDQRSKIYAFPADVFIIINEVLTDTIKNKYFQVIPLRYDEYTRLMSKPFKRPLKHQAWRLINSGNISGTDYIKIVEVITAPEYDNKSLKYTVRFLRRPLPIIVGDIDDLKIGGKTYADVAGVGCELDPILHEDILQRAVELAKVAWTQTGQDNTNLVLQSGQRSE